MRWAAAQPWLCQGGQWSQLWDPVALFSFSSPTLGAGLEAGRTRKERSPGVGLIGYLLRGRCNVQSLNSKGSWSDTTEDLTQVEAAAALVLSFTKPWGLAILLH